MCRTKFRYLSASNAMKNHEVSEHTIKFQPWCFLCTTRIIGSILFAGYKSTPTLSATHFWDHLDTCPITVEYKLLSAIYRICSRNLRTFFILAAEKSGCVKYADFFLWKSWSGFYSSVIENTVHFVNILL